MKLGYDTKFALIVSQGAAEVVRVRKDRGPGHTLFMQRDIQNFSDYEENLDVFTQGPEDGSYLKVVHVVATAVREDQLPEIGTIGCVDGRAIDAALPSIRTEIAGARLSKQMKDYLYLLLADHNRATIAQPFLAEAGGDSAKALKMAVRKMAALEASLFADIEARVRETIAPE